MIRATTKETVFSERSGHFVPGFEAALYLLLLLNTSADVYSGAEHLLYIQFLINSVHWLKQTVSVKTNRIKEPNCKVTLNTQLGQ